MRDSYFLSIHKNGPRRSSEAVFVFKNERFFSSASLLILVLLQYKLQSHENNNLVCNDASYDAHFVYKLGVCTK